MTKKDDQKKQPPAKGKKDKKDAPAKPAPEPEPKQEAKQPQLIECSHCDPVAYFKEEDFENHMKDKHPEEYKKMFAQMLPGGNLPQGTKSITIALVPQSNGSQLKLITSAHGWINLYEMDGFVDVELQPAMLKQMIMDWAQRDAAQQQIEQIKAQAAQQK